MAKYKFWVMSLIAGMSMKIYCQYITILHAGK